jgi:uncharacterized protein YprB with RNaseH-like and TPR domain
MLTRSFCHIPGIGPKAELKLWESGIESWEKLHDEAPQIFKAERSGIVREKLAASNEAYQRNDLYYFYQTMPREHLWRLLPGRLDEVAYLDIETTGMGRPPACHSTTITFYHRGEVLQEHDRERKRLLIDKVLAESSILCTFFGECFDVPFLQQEYGIEFRKAHLDLCHWMKRLGHQGGLKKIQKRFPEIPLRESLDIDGFDAVRLWQMHRRGVEGALETLLTYNAEDTIVLAPLLAKAFNLELERQVKMNPTVFESARHSMRPLAIPALPALHTGVSRSVYNLLRERV